MTMDVLPAGLVEEGMTLTLQLVIAGRPAVVVLGGRGNGGEWTDTAGVEIWRDAAWNQFRNLVHTGCELVGAVCRDLGRPNGQVIEVGKGASPIGAVAGSQTLQAASTLIKWKTATGGRSGKGRTFLPALPASGMNSDGRTYQTTWGTTVQAAVNSYLGSTALAGQGITPAVLSRVDQRAYPITGGSLATVIGVQRRRMR